MNTFLGISIWGIAKWFVVFGLSLYVIFAGVVVRQVQLMINTLKVGFETPIIVASYIHLGISIVIFFLALIIL